MADPKALEALAQIGEKEDWRAAFIRQLIAFEHTIEAPGVDVREELTGPLVDALYDDDQVVRKTLSNGVTFEFLYRSKIARDFVMSEPEAPDHAWEPMTSRILVDLAKGAKNVVIGSESCPSGGGGSVGASSSTGRSNFTGETSGWLTN